MLRDYNSSNLESNPEEMESMLYARDRHACSLIKSSLHEGRPILLAAGSFDGLGAYTAESLDFTKKGSSWQESNLIFASILSVYYVFLRWANE